MGIFHSFSSVFYGAGERQRITDNVLLVSPSQKKGKRYLRTNSHQLSNNFFLGGKQFKFNLRPYTCLFNDDCLINQSHPIEFQLSKPSRTIEPIQAIKCQLAIRRDTLKLIHLYDDWYTIEFLFDCETPVQIYIYFFSHESLNQGLKYTCCTKTSDIFKQYYSFTFNRGYQQLFSKKNVRFTISVMKKSFCSTPTIPIVIICRSMDYDMSNIIHSPTTDLSSNHSNDSTSFDQQYHIVSATVKFLNDDNKTPRSSAVLTVLQQKHVVNGILFELYEIYGVENTRSSSDKKIKLLDTVERRKSLSRKQNDYKGDDLCIKQLDGNELQHHVSGTNENHDRITTTASSSNKRKLSRTQISNTAHNEIDVLNDNVKHNYKIKEFSSLRQSPSSSIASSCLDLSKSTKYACVICLCEFRNTLILPCKHLAICNVCGENLRFQSNSCPICRLPFRALLQLNTLKAKRSILKQQTHMYESTSIVNALNLSSCSRVMHKNDNESSSNNFLIKNKIGNFCHGSIRWESMVDEPDLVHLNHTDLKQFCQIQRSFEEINETV
ncbi:unnamed protein product [Didymodactylos carnosus]|uniref:RING-type domain-containing protein n=1 Tax=Didymodactylos carnosus TaxID=1234261 RepID=A0A813Q5R3_9BILA|nr:unnamed protein product [Didymodactylos carnosus]CAF0851830.1 unnamed protein product [Didymodactylos carnosus]CAF3543410.1 unnamed protein product [Didymodactylos carnosus]CAF3637022.1 unnamed protein product [Didymodactylos carnosus]